MILNEARKKVFEARVTKDIRRAFPDPDPDAHRYVIENDRYSFYLYDSRPDESHEGGWTKTPIAKFSFLDGEKLWQLSWMPPQGRWQKYGRYFDVETATIVIKGDPAGCFLGDLSPLAYLKRDKKEPS